MNYYGKTDKGKVRSENQDTLKISPIHLKCSGEDALLSVVCDGMGGANAGNLASNIAADTFCQYVCRQVEAFACDISNPENIPFEKILRDGVASANKAVFTKSTEGAEFSGMGTTLVACLSTNSFCYYVNVGDSRAYELRYGKLSQVTHDHSYVQSLLDSGSISEEQAQNHPEKNIILRAVGTSPTLEADIFTKITPPSALLLCSDGLSNMVDKNEIYQVLSSSTLSENTVSTLVDMANDAGGSDNISAIVIYF